MRTVVGVIVLVLVLGACGGDNDTEAQSETSTTTSEPEPETTTSTTSTTEASRIRPETEDALRACSTSQVNFARDLLVGFVEDGAFRDVSDTCDAALDMLDTDTGSSALVGMDIALRNSILAKWQLDLAETGEALPTNTGLTPIDASLRWEREMDEIIADL